MTWTLFLKSQVSEMLSAINFKNFKKEKKVLYGLD